MKPHAAPPVPGNTAAEKFDNAVRTMFSVSKEAFFEAEAEYQRTKPAKKRAKRKAKVRAVIPVVRVAVWFILPSKLLPLLQQKTIAHRFRRG